MYLCEAIVTAALRRTYCADESRRSDAARELVVNRRSSRAQAPSLLLGKMGAKFSSASGEEASDAAGTPAPPPAESLLAKRRAAHSMRRRADSDSQSQQHVLSQPDVVQRFVEYLPFDEVTKIKAVARPFRTAARRALTRGRWRPLRFLYEHGESATRESIAGTVRLSSDEVDLLHEAWAIAPGKVLRIILDWQPVDTYIASVFLRYVEPGTRYQQDMDELRKCPRTTTCLLSSFARPDGGFARVVAAFEYCNSKLIDLPLRDRTRVKMVRLLVIWLGVAHHDVFNAGYRRNVAKLASPEWLGNELELWANPIEAAKFVISGPFVTPMPEVTIDVPWHGVPWLMPVRWNIPTLRRLITSGWKDRSAASAFDRHLFDWTRTAEGRAIVGDPPSW